MSTKNGVAEGPPLGRRRVVAIPKTMVFEIDVIRRGKPTTIEVTGYVKGACKVWVEAQVQAAWDEWEDASYVDNVDQIEVDALDPETNAVAKTTPARIFKRSRRAEAMLRRDMLLAVVEGLEEQDADLLAQEDGGWLDILRDLGWWRKASAEEATGDPEAVGEADAPTGTPSSPTPAITTGPTTG